MIRNSGVERARAEANLGWVTFREVLARGVTVSSTMLVHKKVSFQVMQAMGYTNMIWVQLNMLKLEEIFYFI